MTKDSIKKQIEKLGLAGTVLYYAGRFLSKAEQMTVGRATGKFAKVKKNRMVFKNRAMQDFTDNPRAFFEYLTENGYNENYEMIWLVSEKRKFKNCHYKNVRFVTAENKYGWNSPLSYYYADTAEYFFYSHNAAGLNAYRCKGQKVINLWHGCGYKGVEHGAGKEAQSSVKADFDYALVPGAVFADTKSKVWNCKKEILLQLGYPRYDWMLNPSMDKEQILSRLFGKKTEKIILWMPTFRKSELKGCREGEIELPYQLPALNGSEDLEELDHLLEELDMLLVIKKHPLQIGWKGTEEKLSNICYLSDGMLEKEKIRLYEVVGISDALISDYSSIAVDYLLLDRPIGYVLADYELYKEKRGYVFDDPLEYMPGEKLYDRKDIAEFLQHISDGTDLFRQERQKMLPLMHNKTDNYCRRLAEYLEL